MLQTGELKVVRQISCSTKIRVIEVKDDADNSYVLKTLSDEYPDQNDISSLRYEYEILHGLNISGVPKALEFIPYGSSYAIIFEYFDGQSLDILLKSKLIEFGLILLIMLKAAKILAEIHDHNIIHKDINPSNILWNESTQTVLIIDFNCASRLPEEKLELVVHSEFQGTPAYSSPEQTGRINRGIDSRADLYSLGITFFELLTGQLPYYSSDISEMIHFHLAGNVISPRVINKNIPPVVSEIVLKCVERNADYRYQSASGLAYDLKHCYEQWTQHQSIKDFPIRQKENLNKLSFSSRLYVSTTTKTTHLAVA